MFYPTGDTTKGRCLVCIEDEKPEISEALNECNESCVTECMGKWLEEKNYCVEKWQLKEYLKEMGCNEEKIMEDMGAAPAPTAASAPAPGLATLGNVPGMGNPTPPSNDGTNAGFYDPSKTGSGDKFTTLTAGTAASRKKGKKGKNLISYMDFIKNRKK